MKLRRAKVGWTVEARFLLLVTIEKWKFVNSDLLCRPYGVALRTFPYTFLYEAVKTEVQLGNISVRTIYRAFFIRSLTDSVVECFLLARCKETTSRIY